MKISSNSPVIQLDPKVQSQQVAEKSSNAVDRSEKVSVSPQALSIQSDEMQIRRVLDTTEDVRMDKVALIKQEIENGTYQRDAQEVADKMIAAHLLESQYRK